MGTTSSILKDQELNEFRKLSPSTETDLELPVPAKERTLTDKKGFIIFGIMLLVLIPFLIYTFTKADIRRNIYGGDSCGNLCGVKNNKIKDIACSGRDFSNKPFEIFVNIGTGESTCTDECPPGYYEGDDNHCFQDNSKSESKDLLINSLSFWWKYVIIVLITTALCILTLVLFRYCPAAVVWGASTIGVLLSIAVAALFWFLFSKADYSDSNKQLYIFVALVSTVFTIVTLILFLIFRKNIQLIILLYKETAKALFAMPLMMLIPLITLVLQFIIVFLMLYDTAILQTAGNLKKNEDSDLYFYRRNGAMIFTLVFNVIVTIWALEFFAGCQYMVLCGSVAQWFFKTTPNSPISTSFTYTVRYHLGTVAFGSFIITLVAVIKALIKSLISNATMRRVVDCCCSNITAFLNFLSKNAYIETAIYGQSFLRSGKRAAKLLITNASSVISVNFVGDFVLGMTQFILLVISTAIAYGIFSNTTDAWFPVVLSFIANFIIVIIVFSVFETIVDTLLVCFCEDTSLNNGTTKPYRMSAGYMQFVEETKKVYKN